MLDKEMVDSEQLSLVPTGPSARAVEVPNALPVRLQSLDLARHIAITPEGKRYVVATFDDRRIGRGLVTAVYPQQNDYLTLVRLVICELQAKDFEQAIQQHIKTIQTIQQGRIDKLSRARRR
jgi:hypothetical protein